MKNLQTFNEFLTEGRLNEASFSEGDRVQHRTFSDLSGVVKSAPMKWKDLERRFRGIDMPEPDEYTSRQKSSSIWFAILLDDGDTFFGANADEFQPA
jgi:hypothetical protein